MPFANSGVLVVLMIVAIGLAIIVNIGRADEPEHVPYDWSADEET